VNKKKAKSLKKKKKMKKETRKKHLIMNNLNGQYLTIIQKILLKYSTRDKEIALHQQSKSEELVKKQNINYVLFLKISKMEFHHQFLSKLA